jgi:hypothetical protein
MLSRALAVLALSVVGGCSMFTEPEHRLPQRVLFIGNSLTESNNLPGLVQAIADSAGLSITVKAVTLGATNLLDHWNGPDALAEIDRGWDVVVLQQGPTSRAVDRVELRMVAARYARRIRAAGGEPGLYMVWPAAGNSNDFASISRSYRLAAEDVNGYLFPAGEAWLEAWRRNISLPLYSSDGFHPSAYGTYAAALTIFGVTWERSVVGLPSRYRLADLTSIWINPVDARVIQEAVDEANRTHARRPR